MDLYVIGVGSSCVIANQHCKVWSGQTWGDLQNGKLFASRSLAQIELTRIEESQSTMKTNVNRVGTEEFPRYVIVTEDEEVWNGEGFGHIRSALVYAHRNLAEQDAARIEAEHSDSFHDE